jgi:hypothetical protein
MAKIKKPLLKKAQTGVVVSQDKKGNYIYTKKKTTKDGPRYYQGKSVNREMAESIANFKSRAATQDSTRKADLLPFELKKMDEKKKGGVIKKMQAGGKIEEQYQKQKKVTSKQAEMDKIKTPYPKTTLKKAQNGKSTARKAYDEQYKFLKEARNAIGKNDKKKLSELRFDKPYNNNDLANDFSKAQRLRKKAGLGIGEEAKLLFPHVGQQMRGAVNSMLGTNFKKGGVVKKSTVKKTVAKKVVKSIKKKK